MLSPQAPAVRGLFHPTPKFTLIAGPCVAESYELCLQVAQAVAALCKARDIAYIFKASFDKANRTSLQGYRGHGVAAGLDILRRVRSATGLPILTDIHTAEQAKMAAEVVDVLQIPAFLCRQTDLLHAAAQTGVPTNIKKGQFLAPEDMAHVVHKFRAAYAAQHTGPAAVAVTERGACFGYHNLVVDMRGLVIMAHSCAAPVIFDATHAVQRPSAGQGHSCGDRHMAPVLARAAVAVGVDALFCEVHPDPDKALSDGPNSLDLPMLAQLLDQVVAIRRALQP